MRENIINYDRLRVLAGLRHSARYLTGSRPTLSAVWLKACLQTGQAKD